MTVRMKKRDFDCVYVTRSRLDAIEPTLYCSIFLCLVEERATGNERSIKLVVAAFGDLEGETWQDISDVERR